MHWNRRYLVGVLVLLPACGGGGGGGGQPAGTAVITMENAEAVARAVFGSSEYTDDLNRLASDILEDVDLRPGTTPCGTAGNSTVSFVDRSPVGTPSRGDTTTITLRSCVNNVGGGIERLDGSMSFGVVKLSDTAVVIAFTFGDLAGIVAGQPVATDGDMTLELRDAGSTEPRGIIRGKSLTFSGGGVTTTLENYRFEETADLSTDEFRSERSGTVRDDALGGPVTFQTTRSFESVGGSTPNRGRLRIKSVNGSTLLLTVIDNRNL